MIDTHSHLDGEEFAEDLPEVIQRAKDAGVEQILVPAINLETLPHLLEVCSKYTDYLHPMIGLHPEDVKENYKEVLREMHDMINENICAIGEIGLDFYWDDTYKTQQIDAFETQIGWAIEKDLPLMIHTRKAYNEMISIMEKHRGDNLRGVFHCFSASKEIAEQLLSFPGFMLGIGGIVTFKNSNLPEVLRTTVPLDRIVAETDSPYMAPVPHRGKRNESAYIVEVLRKLSEVYECDFEEISKKTNKNCKIFRNVKNFM